MFNRHERMGSIGQKELVTRVDNHTDRKLIDLGRDEQLLGRET